jgi:hypothetical protein
LLTPRLAIRLTSSVRARIKTGIKTHRHGCEFDAREAKHPDRGIGFPRTGSTNAHCTHIIGLNAPDPSMNIIHAACRRNADKESVPSVS